ncbi:MAG: hypothetical protein JSS20_09415 [Proteobacteria bacterium]|nr:hypothetical protein [Pseudomonadota bacterium]
MATGVDVHVQHLAVRIQALPEIDESLTEVGVEGRGWDEPRHSFELKRNHGFAGSTFAMIKFGEGLHRSRFLIHKFAGAAYYAGDLVAQGRLMQGMGLARTW